MTFVVCAGLWVVFPAYALDPGECGTPEVMTAKLKAEGQRSAMMADQVMPGKKLQAVIFTTNQDGSVGYIMLSDKMSDERASEFCVQERLTDLRWHDARKKGVPTAAKIRGSDTDAEKHCKKMEREGVIKFDRRGEKKMEGCRSLNATLDDRGEFGFHPMMQGFPVAKASDGTYKRVGEILTVIGKSSEIAAYHESRETAEFYAGGIITTWLPEGASIIGRVLASPKYTGHGLTLLP